MSLQHGRGEGVSGLIDMIVDGITHSNYTYNCRVYGWDWEAAFAAINRSGRQGRPKFRLGDFNGKGTATGQVQAGAYPFPSNPKYATGTLTLTQDLGSNSSVEFLCGVKFPIRIPNFSMAKHNAKHEGSSDLWDVAHSWIMDGAATISWNGTQVTITAATQNFCETDVGLSKTIDPNNLTTRATQRFDAEGIADNDTAEVAMLVAYMAGATPPFAGALANTAHWVRSDAAGGSFVIDWRLRDSVQDVTFPRTHSARYSMKPYSDSDAYLVAASGNVATQANALWDAFKGTSYAAGLVLSVLTPQKRVVTYEYINPGFTYKVTDSGVPKTITAQMIGGNPYVNIVQNVAYGSGRRRVVVSPISYAASGREIMSFSLIRNITGSVLPRQNPQTIPETGGTTMPNFNQANNATFLGLAAGCVLYFGTGTVARFVNSDSTSWLQAFHFMADSFGIIVGEPIVGRRRPLTIVSNATGTGLVLASSLGPPFDGMGLPSQASFAAFTA